MLAPPALPVLPRLLRRKPTAGCPGAAAVHLPGASRASSMHTWRRGAGCCHPQRPAAGRATGPPARPALASACGPLAAFAVGHRATAQAAAACPFAASAAPRSSARSGVSPSRPGSSLGATASGPCGPSVSVPLDSTPRTTPAHIGFSSSASAGALGWTSPDCSLGRPAAGWPRTALSARRGGRASPRPWRTPSPHWQSVSIE
mmetsp:Transcript_35494/g.112829  ORF Transcript_35494/g.112829 Transcript_35494/m.112829 type:complete len:203 (-) Transcript_35494:88-696(-)